MSKNKYISLSVLMIMTVFSVANMVLAEDGGDKPQGNFRMGPRMDGGPQRMGQGQSNFNKDVKREDFKGGMGVGMANGVKPVVLGKVDSISGTTLTVSSRGFDKKTATTTYTVDASNAKVSKENATSTVASITVGDNVMILGTITGNNVVATVIRDGKGGMMPGGEGKSDGKGRPSMFQGNGQPVVAGNVAAVSGSTITIKNESDTTYTVDATNAKVLKGNATSTVADIVVGDHVVVQGTVNGTSITATSVFDQVKKPDGQRGDDKGGENNGDKNNSEKPGFFGKMKGFFGRMFGF